jgi:hypothetical protein
MSRITQRGATGPLAIQANGTFQTSTDASLVTLLGSRWDLDDGREVRLGQVATGTTVVPGKMYQSAAVVANHSNLTVTAFQAYSANGNVPAKVTVTLGGTAVTANQYRGGFVSVNDNNGQGQTLKIASHPAQSSTTGDVALTLEDGPTTAITTASQVTLLPADGSGIIIMPTTATGAVFGASMYDIAASAYGFFVTRGITTVLDDGGLTIGSTASPSNATAGALENGVLAQGIVGNVVAAGVSTEYIAVNLNI